ncbi:hypothetical protein CO051_01380 [Candidatus Roizmanbacteria bacterium CG_4_9_14_0_2_um_filter_39_13]|uniref:Polymerase nucleotidyl transferase domain-containing protein n=2 Tax=Candidatus Roizmaniibacteriota TaxID=1752723 RepID=A0A2M8F2L1_9BACT|nr:MAG: hypothetical protein CO051_01380 [Candidatus Roizmanbacteria bacterium CG_4_9_14_0_2_um_filter_39_13]PJE62208.1 MAG: hypothetical protein COU87_00490 [Candidatus Roizmanbacteria bacterium CG10_big_fil_rev_8_21_14_0_10_39_12]
MGKRQARTYLKQYIKRLNEDIYPQDVIVYGSFLRDDYNPETSDIDLLVIADIFVQMDEDERLRLLYRKTTGLPLDFHLYGFTRNELKNIGPLNSLYHAVSSGVSLFS